MIVYRKEDMAAVGLRLVESSEAKEEIVYSRIVIP